MRNYIHVMLCVSLCMAQLVFIIGIDRIENEVISHKTLQPVVHGMIVAVLFFRKLVRL